MERTISLVFLLWFMFFNGCFLFQVDALKAKAKFKLIHRHSPELGDNPGTSLGPPINSKERIKQLVHSDYARLHTISHRLTPGRKNYELKDSKINMVELPMRSAADIGAGQYFVSFRIGTPPKKFILVADTGSSLTWMKCKYQCSDCCSDRVLRNERLFHPNQSSTFKPIPCSSEFCKVDLTPFFSLSHCPAPQAPCGYDYRYHDSTRVLGSFGNDTVKIRLSGGQKIKMTNVTVGCSEIIKGVFNEIDGVMGLGFETQSFAVKAAVKFGDKFSYCLVDHLSPSNLVNFLVFGGVDDSDTQVPNMQHTQLILGLLNSYYAVNVTGISLNGTMLDIPSYVWDIDEGAVGGGMIVDSGTSVTHLVTPAYVKVIAGLESSISRFKKVKSEGGLEYCFSAQGFNKTLIPRLAIHFADGAKFEPPVKSYVIDEADGVKCLGFLQIPWPGPSILGNVLQQNHLWEFDLLHHKLGFAPSSCTFD